MHYYVSPSIGSPWQQVLKRTFSLRTNESLDPVGVATQLHPTSWKYCMSCLWALGLTAIPEKTWPQTRLQEPATVLTDLPGRRRQFLHSSLSPLLGQAHFESPFYGRRSGPAWRWETQALRYQLSRVVKTLPCLGSKACKAVGHISRCCGWGTLRRPQ